MAGLEPFGALRFTEKAGCLQQLVCPPYDIISEEERKAYLQENPYNIIRLELPREGEDPYRTAGDLLRDWQEQGLVACDAVPGIYVYEEAFTVDGSPHTVKGFVCRVRLEEFEKGVVLPHEETLSKAKEDRFRLMTATGCNFSSIYSLYFDETNQVYPLIDACSASAPDLEFSAMEVTHRVWTVADPSIIASIQKAFVDKKLYIADGHHRYETALRYRDSLHNRGIALEDHHPANFMMMTLVHMEHPGLVVFPTHRIVRGLDSFDGDGLMDRCADYFTPTRAGDLQDLQRLLKIASNHGQKAIGYYGGGVFWCLALRQEREQVMAELLPGTSPAYQQLDVNLLHTLILERLLGIDKENMANQRNLLYTRIPEEALAQVDSGEANCAFLLNPTSVQEIASVSQAGEKMPQKSTYFYPKLITGHVMNQLLR